MYPCPFTVEMIDSALNKRCVDIYVLKYVLNLAAVMYNGECVVGVLNAAPRMNSYENHIYF